MTKCKLIIAQKGNSYLISNCTLSLNKTSLVVSVLGDKSLTKVHNTIGTNTIKMSLKSGQEYKKNLQRAIEYLNRSLANNKSGFQFTSAGTSREDLYPYEFPEDIFLNLTALDLLKDVLSDSNMEVLLKHTTSVKSKRFSTINYFKDDSILPDDTETTSYYYWTMWKLGLIQEKDKERLLDVARIIFMNVNEKGIINTWIRPHNKSEQSPPDATVLANVLRFLTKMNLHKEALPSINFFHEELSSGYFLNGYHYYKAPAVFLYYVSSLLEENIQFYSGLFKDKLVFHVITLAKSVVKDSSVVDISLLILSIKHLVISGFQTDEMMIAYFKLVDELIKRQYDDGGWKEDAVYTWPSRGLWMSGRSLSSIFGTAALQFLNTLTQ